MISRELSQDRRHPWSLPIVLLIDNSSVMWRKEKRFELVSLLQKFKSDLIEDTPQDLQVELAIIAYGKRVDLIQNFSNLENVNLSALEVKRGFLKRRFIKASLAISKAIEVIRLKKQILDQSGIAFLEPLIIMLTDEDTIDRMNNDDHWSEATENINQGIKDKEFKFALVGVGHMGQFVIPKIDLQCFDRQRKLSKTLAQELGILDRIKNHQPLSSISKVVATKECDELPILSKDKVLGIGASTRGPLHKKMGLPCQDAFKIRILPKGYSIVCVADGLGSVAHSDIGAMLVVDEAVKAFENLLEHNNTIPINLGFSAGHTVYKARSALENKAHEANMNLCDLACTIIVVVANRNNIVAAHIGDGAVVARTREGLILVSAPGESEYTNEVTPLTSKNWESSLRVSQELTGIEVFSVFTDGCQRAALSKNLNNYEPFKGFLEPIISYAEEINDPLKGETDFKALLNSDKICSNSEDDKTLVVMLLEKDIW